MNAYERLFFFNPFYKFFHPASHVVYMGKQWLIYIYIYVYI